ncbi:MAG: hypothetical protein LBM07_03965 [Culturomica sp.]|jgi:4-hydroxybenzoate polyprenyltransferase|nr:hypothetical protein [Culturomica sp.]
MSKVFDLIRWRSVLFVVFAMYMTRYFIMQPILEVNNFSLQMSGMDFSMLVWAICCMIASKNTTLHCVLNAVALGILFWLSYSVGLWRIGLLFFMASGMLWFYISSYRRMFVVGNIIIALLAALVLFCPVIFEIPLLNKKYYDILSFTSTNFIYILKWIAVFAGFVFLPVWMYEINRDLYTIDEDRDNYVESMPIVLGERKAKYFISLLVVIVIAGFAVVYKEFFAGYGKALYYMIFALLLPYIVYIYVIFKKNSRKLQLFLIQAMIVLTISFSFLLGDFFSKIFEI